MKRSCSNCALWGPLAGFRTAAGPKYGNCTAPAIGRVTGRDDSCQTFYVPAAGAGFDINVATRAFEKFKEGKLPGPGTPMRPRVIDGEALRQKMRRGRV